MLSKTSVGEPVVGLVLGGDPDLDLGAERLLETGGDGAVHAVGIPLGHLGPVALGVLVEVLAPYGDADRCRHDHPVCPTTQASRVRVGNHGRVSEQTGEPDSMLQRMKLRAFDLSERTGRRGRASLQERLDRWRDRSFMIIQCAVTAGLAWWLAQVVLGHDVPFFAPVAALLCLGVTFGHRLRRGIEVAVGVAVGIAVGDLFVLLFGTGVWQIAVVLVFSMSLATLLGAGQLMIMQAGVQSMLVITLIPDPGQGFDRWLDAVIGCAIALLVATVAPSAPLRRPRILAAQVLQEMAGTFARRDCGAQGERQRCGRCGARAGPPWRGRTADTARRRRRRPRGRPPQSLPSASSGRRRGVRRADRSDRSRPTQPSRARPTLRRGAVAG